MKIGPRVSLLERAARLIEPSPEVLQVLRPAASVARRIVPMKDIKEASKVYRPGLPPKRTDAIVTTLDGTPLSFFSDGSLRHAIPQQSRTKKQRRHELRFGVTPTLRGSK